MSHVMITEFENGWTLITILSITVQELSLILVDKDKFSSINMLNIYYMT